MVFDKIRGVKNKIQWAVFSPDGYIQTRTIADTKKQAQNQTSHEYCEIRLL